MAHLTPTQAARWAKDIYIARTQFVLKGLIKRQEEFSSECLLLNANLTYSVSSFGACIRGAGKSYENDLFVMFRGTTKSLADIITDARFVPVVNDSNHKVHAGFSKTFDSLKESLSTFIGKQQGIVNVHCIGHSLGGAVAHLAAEWIARQFSFNVKLYTFGSPRISFNEGFARALTTRLSPENIFRVYKSSDPVPMVPLFPFFHAPTAGHSYYVQAGGVMRVDSHFIANYIESMQQLAPDGKWNTLYTPPPQLSAAGIRLWLKQDSLESLDNPTVWDKLNYAVGYVARIVLQIAVVPIAVGLTVADYLSMIIIKGVKLVGEAATWVFYLMQKMMKLLGMKAVKTIEELTEVLIKLVLKKIVNRISSYVKRALEQRF